MTDFVTLIRIKAVESDGERWIEGYATTSQEDRQGDVVEPRGAKFSLPIPLLFQHLHQEPIGAVTQATVSEKGIRIRARLSIGVARAEEVWTLVRDGVLTAVSIGFRVLEQKPLGTGGFRFTSWEWLETSIVSVPANPGAQISVAKCMAMDVKELGDRYPSTPVKYIRRDHNEGISIDALKPEDLGKVIGVVLREALEPLKARIAKLEKSIDGRGLKFMGKWNRDIGYQKGDFIKHAGSLWVASRSTTEAPGACTDWQNMLTADKRGEFVPGGER